MVSLSKKNVNLIFVLTVIFGIFIAMPAAAWNDDIIETKKGYVVTSGYDHNISEGEVLETQKIDFWENSPQMIIFCLIYDNIPIFGEVFVILLFSAFTGLAYFFGIKLVNRKNVLENKNRNLIYRIVEEKPGISFTEIVRELGITKTMAKYHLDRLLYYGLITPHSNNGRSGYFRNNDTYSDNEKMLYLIKKNPHDSKIIELVRNSPGITRKEIAGEISLSGPSITWHLERLENSGLIEVVRAGRTTRYYINAGYEILLQNEAKTGLHV